MCVYDNTVVDLLLSKYFIIFIQTVLGQNK